MVLIADSGSTKTTWAMLDSGMVKDTVNTPGMNPYFHTSDSIEAILKADLLPLSFRIMCVRSISTEPVVRLKTTTISSKRH